MRGSSAVVCLAVLTLASGQTSRPASGNAVRLTKYILGVADLNRTYTFYHALGLDLENGKALTKPNPLPEMLLKLVGVPAGTKFRNMMLKIPNTPFDLEVTEFSNLEVHPARPRIQDPGSSLFLLAVGDLDAALATAKQAGAEVVTTGGAPVAGSGRAARMIVLKDPDGYYLELAQPVAMPRGAPGKAIGAAFFSVVVDSQKTAAFYRDQFGFEITTTDWTSQFDAGLGTPGVHVRTAAAAIPGTNVSWGFFEFKGADRKPYRPRIPDPGASALGLQVRDIDAAVAAMKAAGGTELTEGGSVHLGNGKVGFVRDPNGFLVELAQP
jgi:catechol 2,3-dioxygenase-like lactoylglutathione lyase family enzyme